MGIYANGGITSKISFIILATLWMLFTYLAYAKIKVKNIRSHKNFMWRSYALTLSAITLRAWKYGIVMAFEPNPMDVYRLVAWLGWIPNLIAIELWIQWKAGASRTSAT